MSRACLAILIALCVSFPAAAADRALVAWEFNRDGDAEGWVAAHALAPLKVTGGALATRATSGDPYIISEGGQPIDITANDFQYIEIRMKSNKEGGAEFFWANTREGKDAGFVAGQERGFAVRGDGRFRVYRVFPVWEGRVTRLRFDPPEDAAIEVDYIRVVQSPPSRHDPASPRWDFRSDGAGGFTPTSGCRAGADPRGWTVTLESDSATVTSPVMQLRASDYRCVTLHLRSSAPLQLTLSWSDTTDGNFPGANVIPFDVGAGEDWVTLPFDQTPAWSGQVRRVALGVSGPEGATATFESMEFARVPVGPPKLTVVALSGERSIYAVGELIRLRLHVRNDGGARASGVEPAISLLPAGAPVNSSGASRFDLDPAESRTLEWTFTAARPAVISAAVGLAGAGLFRAAAATTQIIVTAPIPALSMSSRGPVAVARGAACVVGNERVRLTFLRGAVGFEGARIDIIDGVRQRTMGSLPHLARLAIDGDKQPVALALAPAGSRSDARSAVLTMRGSRAGVTLTVTYSAAAGRPWIEVRYVLAAARPVALRAFQGPWVWAGEGSFGAAQDHALFPGVEWLVKGERSSSSLDIRPPMHTRFAPHPNWVTVPALAVEKDRAIVGVMWDPLQKWDGRRTRPSAVFASPNFVESRPNHLLGLYLPSIPEYVSTNKLVAAKPYRLERGRSLTLSACLFAKSDADVTDVVPLWYDRYCGAGIAPGLPPMPRDYAATVDMSLRSFENILWKPDVQGWMPVLGWAPGRDLGVAAMYETAARVRQGAQSGAWRNRALQAAAGSNDLTFALRGYGSPESAMSGAVFAARLAAAAQPEGARYVFRPEGQRRSLGPDGATAIGIGSGAVEGLLNSAMRTGDSRAFEAGIRGLAFMDQFDVPRAAQVWECPLHSPDILASGQACRAYLAGYRLTGERRYLDRAVFWARTGLPFVYSWQSPDMPKLMKYSTIPIFGATFYTGSWFGVPVQWNGLDYANACLQVAPYDRSVDWRRIAEGITISGMNQQSIREKDYGTYTDNWNLVTNVECVGCMLSPSGILMNVFQIMGAGHTAGVDGVRTPTGWIAVNGPGSVQGAVLRDGELKFAASFTDGHSGVIAVLPVSRPASVTVDGVAATECRTGTPTAGQWKYSPRLGIVTVGVRFGTAPARVVITGLERREPAPDQTEWRFDQSGDALGWVAANDLTDPVVADDALRMTIRGGDPYMVGPSFSLSAAQAAGMTLCARVSKPGGGVYWETDSGPISPAREASFHIPADGRFHEVTVDLSKHPEWRGTIRRLRLDFNGGPGDTVELRWVRVVRK